MDANCAEVLDALSVPATAIDTANEILFKAMGRLYDIYEDDTYDSVRRRLTTTEMIESASEQEIRGA